MYTCLSSTYRKHVTIVSPDDEMADHKLRMRDLWLTFPVLSHTYGLFGLVIGKVGHDPNFAAVYFRQHEQAGELFKAVCVELTKNGIVLVFKAVTC